MNRFRFYITTLSSRVEVFPLNHWKTSLVDERGDGPIYRRKFNGQLTFSDNNGAEDFSLFYAIEVATPCEMIILEIEEKDSGAVTYHNYWTGHFVTSDGAFDHDRCTFEITPKPYDNYYQVDIDGDKEFNIITAGLTHQTAVAGDYTYTRNYWLMDVIEYLAGQVFGVVSVVSWFLENEVNPIIAGPNQYRALMIAQKSDIKRPLSSNPATIGMLSFNQLMSILRMYNLFWTFDGTTLRIEHYDHWESEAGLDLRNNELSARQNKYSYLREDMPKYEKFAFMEGGDGNYVEHTISYDLACVDEKTTTEYRNNVTTDLSYIQKCMTDPELVSNISDEGWVILGTFADGGVNYVYYGTSYASVNASYNYTNSWAQLIRSFFMHGRVLLSGYINGIAYDFISARKIKQQNIKAVICHEDGYQPEDYITTELGETYFSGQKAYVKQATIYPTGSVDFVLLYGEDKNTEVVLPERSKNLHIIIDTSSYTEIVSILSEPNIYDTYYWILWNDGDASEVCQEIMIPAGTVYQEDLVEELNPVIDVKFNYSDASLSGWDVTYNDNAPMTATVDCPAIPPVPPSPPATTTMIGAGQTSDCAPVHVSWNAAPTATYYVLYRKPDFGLADNWVIIDSTVNTYYDDANQCDHAGVTMTYKVKACNIAGCSVDSDETSHEIICL